VRRSLDMMTGSVIGGRYRVLGVIGAGGMGSVYEGLDTRTGCKVALKALQPGVQSPEKLMRLRREAAMATAIKSEHVCQVHYLGVESGTPFIVMERLHGETLRSRLTDEGSMSLDDVVAIGCQLLDALSDTHAAGVVHRDVKPSNVFLTSARGEEPRVKLIDFGIAKMMGAPEAVTSADVITGTLRYLAPEQLLSLGDLDARADIYAAGVTLFEMLSGHRAYAGSYAEIMHAIILGDPPQVAPFRSDVSTLFDDVLAMAMAKTRDRRFASAQAFKRALIAAWHASIGVTISGMVPTLPELGPRPNEDDDEALTLRPPPMLPPPSTNRDESPAAGFPAVRPPPYPLSPPRRRR
jgi:serine/threonine protein kinase